MILGKNILLKIIKGDYMRLRIRDLREDADLKQQTLANFLCIKQNTYSQFERCVRVPPIEVLIKLAEYYGVSVDYILGLTDNPKRNT